MIQGISKKIAEYILKNNTIGENELSIYQYGIELLVSSIIGITVIMTIGSVLFSIIESIIFIIIFMTLRAFCGGFHASSYLKCNTSSVMTFILVELFSNYVTLNLLSMSIISIICMFIIALVAPIENRFKPIDDSDKTKFKYISLCFLVFFLIASFILSVLQIHFYNNIIYTLISITILAIIGLVENKSKKNKSR